MDEQRGKLLRLVDHPRFRTTLLDPELVETSPGEWMTREELRELDIPDQGYEHIDWENEEGVPLTPCIDCKYSSDTRRPLLRILHLGRAPAPSEMICTLLGKANCALINPDGSCEDFDVDIHYG